MILKSYNSKIVFMTGTPASNDPFEIVPCINMIAGKEILINDYNAFIGNYFTRRSL